MSTAGRARRLGAAAAVGGGGLTAAGLLAGAVLAVEARLARRWIGQPFGLEGPDADGVYGFGPGEAIELAMLGDSSADGLGAARPEETPGAIIASGLAAVAGRPVRLTSVAVVGAESTALDAQVDRLLAAVPSPHVAVIMIGANDVTHRIRVAAAVHALTAAVRRLREAGCEVVVATCPDLGTIEPLPPPLRGIARRWSRDLAAAQTVGVVHAGGRSVSLGDLLGPEFAASPTELFSADRFHPSAAGYARCASVLLPSVCAAAGYWPDGGRERVPDPRRGEAVATVAEAAIAAAEDPGMEVTAAVVDGETGGIGPSGASPGDTADGRPLARWATLLRRRLTPLPAVRAARRDEESATTVVDDV